ncbi:MAG: hypothetical protein HETSPECPRED_007035 [Heterodermia speciosa]|uniref:C2H2-type domain-containing protein n=1 Tax=Heterodermia speciosa TaxID=116794 RepID=A0A8H3EKJ8_9LECA|nr:MAG: hypothetical protein HETSPECPRED_007035 [Heterodermia speciosa]
MSRSYSHGSDHSRGSRSRGQSHLSVTEAGYQTLPLQGSAGSHHTSTYNPQDPRYPRISHHGGETASSYLQAGFDTSSFGPSSPSETYIDPSRLTTGFTPSSSEGLDFLNPQSSTYSRTDMGSSYYAQDPYRGSSPYLSSRSPSVPAYSYSGAEATPHRSMSGSSGPAILPSSVPSERGMVRQRRREPHSRRSNKLRVRREALPSIPEARPSVAPDMSQSIDFVVASTTASPYSLPGTYDPHNNRTPSLPSSYLPSTSSPYVSSNYHYGTSMSGPAYSHGSGYSSSQSAGSRRTSTAPSASPNTEGSMRVLESRSRPQCWDHGCNGRPFSTFSNLLRHQREKSGTATKSYCPRCGAEFTRTTARNGHVQEGKCSKQAGDRRKSPADR